MPEANRMLESEEASFLWFNVKLSATDRAREISFSRKDMLYYFQRGERRPDRRTAVSNWNHSNSNHFIYQYLLDRSIEFLFPNEPTPKRESAPWARGNM